MLKINDVYSQFILFYKFYNFVYFKVFLAKFNS
jgi:hypothetical protein